MKFKLAPDHNTPIEPEMNGNTHALIRITKTRHCKSLNLVAIDEEVSTLKSLAAKPFNQLDLVGCEKFTVAASFAPDPDAFVEGQVYTGSWEEMILTETELSFTDSPFYISCSMSQVEFMIGAPGESRMAITPAADGGFSIVTTIVHAGAPESSIESSIADDTEASQVVKRLYGRIKGRVNGQGFEKRQEENKEKYAENFTRTVLEGFHSL